MEEFLLTKTQIINSNKCRFSNILSSMKSSANIITDFGWSHGHIIDSIRRAYGWGFLFFLRQYCHPNSKRLHTSSFLSVTPRFSVPLSSQFVITHIPAYSRQRLSQLNVHICHSGTSKQHRNYLHFVTMQCCNYCEGILSYMYYMYFRIVGLQ